MTGRGIPVVVMEPCRGGSLASLPEGAESLLRKVRPQDSAASWAFRFLQSLPGVQVVLSGMTTLEQLKENIAVFSREDPVTPEERQLLNQVVSLQAELVPCTACRYCCENCPQGLDIPKLLSMYNELNYSKGLGTLRFTLDAMKPEELPGACIGCGACAEACPQNIDVPSLLGKFARELVP